MSRTKLNLIVTAVAVAVLSIAAFAMSSTHSSARAATADPVAYSFIVWGDIRPGSTALHASYSAGWQHVRDKMAATPHAFDVVVGDLVNITSSDSLATDNAKYADFFTALGSIKSIPKAYVSGNHESVGQSAAAAAAWEKNIHPAHYDVFTHGAGTAASPRVVVIDLATFEAGYSGRIGYVAEGSAKNSAQANWLVDQLRAHAQDAHTFVVINMHVPLADPKPGEYYVSSPERPALETLFAKYGVDLVVAGHVHAYIRHMMPDGTPYIVQGMAGADPVGESYATATSPGTDAIRIGSDSTGKQYGFTKFDVTTTGRLLATTYVTKDTNWAWRIGDTFEVPQQPQTSPSPSPSPTPTTVLVSRGQPAGASSIRTGHGARRANDGLVTTRWAASSRKFPQWWRVDLGSAQTVMRVRVRFYDPAGTPRTYAYKIQRSRDRQTWTKWNSGQSARYIRIYVTGLRKGRGAASIVEARVFAPAP